MQSLGMRIQKLREQGKDFAALLTCMQTLPRPEAPATPTYYVVPPAEMQQAFRLHRRADTTPATQRGELHPSCGTPLATAAGCTHHAHVPPFGRATAPPGSAVPTSCAFRRFPRHHLRARITPRALKSFEYRRASSTWARLIAKIYGVDPQGGSPSGSESRGGESPLICPRCGNSMRVLAVITDPSRVDRILRHLIKIGCAPPGLIYAPLH